jgi:hypothetical protein
VERARYQILPLTWLKRSARRSFLGKVEHAGVRFIITDYGQAVAELGPLSRTAEQFLAQAEPEIDETHDSAPRNGTTGQHDSSGAHLE